LNAGVWTFKSTTPFCPKLIYFVLLPFFYTFTNHRLYFYHSNGLKLLLTRTLYNGTPFDAEQKVTFSFSWPTFAFCILAPFSL
jgi:hypothetical protein